MPSSFRLLCLTFGFWGLMAAQAAQDAPAPLIPPAAFYGPATIEHTELSPSGRWLALRTAVGGERAALMVFDLERWRMNDQAVRYMDADVGRFSWVNDERLVYTLTDRQRGGGDQRWGGGLFSVRFDGTQPRMLVQLNRPFLMSERRVGREPLAYNHVLLHVPDGGGDEVIIGEVQRDASGDFKGLVAKRLNVVNGSSVSLSIGLPVDAWHWWFDARGEPRVILSRKAGRQTVHWRESGTNVWRQLAEFPAYEAPFEPRFVDSAGDFFVVTPSQRHEGSELRRFDIASGKPLDEAVVSAPGFDFKGSLVSETQGGRTLGVRVVTDAETTVWSDPRLAALQLEADRILPGKINRLNCRRCDADDMTVIVDSWSDTDPGQIWVYFAKTQRWRKFGDERPQIDPKLMARTDFERIRARDGLELPVWITRPAGAAGKALPAVLLVHGGPWVRGRHWRWKADAQFLASRGYVVIEPEFRGSEGYGLKLLRAGYKQWGRAMQDDLLDAVEWAAGKGWVDPTKVCIAGSSYGGYATLMGLVRHPKAYRCGVAWAAVTDPRLLFEWRNDSDVSDEARQFDYPLLVGDPVADARMLADVAPVLNAQHIRAPLLLAFGGSDQRVPSVHGTRMRDALSAAGNPPEWVLYPDEGHGWYKLATRLDFAARVEDFLARHLK